MEATVQSLKDSERTDIEILKFEHQLRLLEAPTSLSVHSSICTPAF